MEFVLVMFPASSRIWPLSLLVFMSVSAVSLVAQGSSDAPPPPPPPPEDFLDLVDKKNVGTMNGVVLKKVAVDDGEASKHMDALIERLHEYWSYNLDDDFYAMYEMVLPESRTERTFKDFTKISRANITNFAVKSVSVWGDQCASVITKGQIKSEHMDLNGVSLRQKWVLQDGVWYLYMRSPKDYIPMFGMRNSGKKGPCPLPEELLPEMEDEDKEETKSVRHSL